MSYLILKFENASIITPSKPHDFKHFVRHLGFIDCEMPDISNPIGVNQLSNALHVMCGLAPCASKRDTVFKRNEIIYNLAKGAYIRYDDIINNELFQDTKIQNNSTAKIQDKHGNDGVYNWSYFKRNCYSSKEYMDEFLGILNYICGVSDVTKELTIHDTAKIIGENIDNEIIKKFIIYRSKYFMDTRAINALEEFVGYKIERLEKNETQKLNVSNTFWYLFFNIPFKGSNIVANGSYNPNAILQTHGVKYRKNKFSGDIIIPIEDKSIIDQINENGLCPTILDGGLITIVGIKTYIPQFTLEHNFKKII